MRIAMGYHYFWPHQGGIESAAGTLARELVRMGHEVSFVTSDIGAGGMRPAFEKIEGIEVIRLKTRKLPSRAVSLLGLEKAIKLVKPDVWHAHHPSPTVADKIIFHAKSAGVASVISYHADGADESFRDRLLGSIYYKTIGGRMLRLADRIIAHSTSYVKSSKWLRPLISKVKIIPLAIDPKEFHGANGADVRKEFRLEKAKVLCSLGRMIPYKGYDYLVRAVEHLDTEWTLLLGGSGPEERKLRRLSKTLGLEKRVIFAGWIPESRKKDFYAAADVFALSSISRGEAFGVSALEAMASGVPVVLTDIPGPRDIIGAKTVPPRDPVLLAQAVEEAYGKKVTLDPVYDIRNAAKNVEEIYRDLL